MIIYDIAAAFHANAYALKKLKTEVSLENLRIRTIDHITSTNKKLFGEYGKRDVVIACESDSWRKKEFPLYKFKRKGIKDKDDLDWDNIHNSMSIILSEFKTNLPYRVIAVKNAEGDDVIASLCKNFRNKKIAVVSRDKDFKQLVLKDENIKIYDPLLKTFLKKEKDVGYFLFQHCLKGDSSDGIPNVFSSNDFYAKENQSRQKSIFEKDMKIWYELPEIQFKEVLGDDAYNRFQENKKLIDFNYIPEKVVKEIVSVYENYEVPKNNAYKYLIQNNLTQFLEDINYF